MKLNILNKKTPKNLDELKQVLLKNRSFKTKKEIDEFLSPSRVENLNYKDAGIDEKEMKKAIKLIKKYIDEKNKIIIYSDYDADGVCAGSILWQALYSVGADVMPFIPSREEDGYGLSKSGIDKILALYPNQKILIITVDNGIVANEAAQYLSTCHSCEGRNLNLIITDHHVKSNKIPLCDTLIHTTKICGAGVAWFLSKEIFKNFEDIKNIPEYKDTMDLLTIATVADMVPLTKFNRQIVFHGFPKLKKTTRIGLLEIFQEAMIIPDKINTHTIGFIIAPRINAMGRLTNALNSFRLLCTRSHEKAKEYARELGTTNRDRQSLTFEQTEMASVSVIKKHESSHSLSKILIEIDDSFNQGVIGLIAGRLMERFYRPAIVISRGEEVSKASARSIPGFNIIEHLRLTEHLLINCGGHPMAAGFTIKTEKIEFFTQEFLKIADKTLNEEDLIKKISVDCELPILLLNLDILPTISQFEPFGVANPEPLFLIKDIAIVNMRHLGAEQQHVKFVLKSENHIFEAIFFNFTKKNAEAKVGEHISFVFSLSENVFNGKTNLQVKIRELVKKEKLN